MPLLKAFLMRQLKPLAAIRKRKGAIGSPYLRHLPGWNSSEGLPLTKTEIDVDSRHTLIQEIHFSLNIILLIIYSNNS